MRAPWTDYASRAIHEGDTIRHPDGMEGVVVCHADRQLPEDQWVVRYADDGYEARLCLQVGDKGQAVIVEEEVMAKIGGEGLSMIELSAAELGRLRQQRDALADVLESIVKYGAWYPTAIELDYAIGEGPAGDDLRMAAVEALEAVGRKAEREQ